MPSTRRPYTKAQQFIRDMERAGFTVEDHPTRDGYVLPSVQCHMGHNPYERLGYDLPDAQDVVRATRLRLRWDGCGGLVVVMPVEG